MRSGPILVGQWQAHVFRPAVICLVAGFLVACGAPPPGDQTPSPSPGVPAGTDRFAAVDSALDELVAGNVAFNTPDRMLLGESRTITALVSPAFEANRLGEELKRRVGSRAAIQVEAIRVAPVMEATLEGEPAFAVHALTPQQQAVGAATPTEWKWTVTAKQDGVHPLHLGIVVILNVEGERTPRSLPVLDRDIVVDVTASQRITGFLSDNWQFILGTLAIPLVGWFAARNSRRKRRPKR